MSAAHDELVQYAMGVDESAAAVLMDHLLRHGRLAPEVARVCVPRAWDLCSWPMRVLPREGWVALFREAGYTHEYEPASRPVEPVRLFRGSDEVGREGLCWSSNVDVARWFAVRYEEGWVWSAVVEPWRLLAFVAETYEDQFVVDTTGLEVEVVEDPAAVAALDVDEIGARLDALVEERHGGGQ